MVGLSLSEAAQQAGVSKEVILRAVHKGRLAVARNDNGLYAIEPSDLSAVWSGDGEEVSFDRKAGEQDGPVDYTAALEAEIAQLRGVVSEMKTSLESERQHVDELKQETENLRIVAGHRPKKRGWMGFGI